MARYNVGIIGLGMGRTHLRAIQAIPSLTAVALCDVDLEKTRMVAREHDVERITSDYRELVADPAIDLIVVASPDHFHREHTVAALEAGKHVLCEKPMAPSADECAQMVAAADRSRGKLMIGHIVRFTPIFQTIKQLVDDGDLGEVFYVGTDYQHDYAKLGGANAWRFDPKLARHVFLGGGCHAVDLMRWFLGPLAEVTAVANHIALPQSPTDDCIIACYTSESNQLGRVFVSSGCHRPYSIELAVYGTKGTAMATNVDTEARLWLSRVPGLGGRWMTLPASVDNHPARTQLEHFVGCIEADRQPLIDGREGMRTAIAALTAIQASHAQTKLPLPAVEPVLTTRD